MRTSSFSSKLCSRSEWGQSLDLKGGWTARKETPIRINPLGVVLHHTETTEAFNAPDHPSCKERVRYWFTKHVQTWSDIAYHFIICPHGIVFEGREEERGKPVQGAHALNNNEHSLGVALMGNFCRLDPTDVAVESLKALLVRLCHRFDIVPQATIQWQVTDEDGKIKTVLLPSVVAHSDLKRTECPGYRFYHCIKQWRRELQNRCFGNLPV